MKVKRPTYSTLYKNSCQKFLRKPKPPLEYSLKNNEINFNIDLCDDTDLAALGHVVAKFTDLDKIQIFGKYFKNYVKHLVKSVLGGTLPTATPSLRRKTGIGRFRTPMPKPLSKDLN